MIIGNLQRCCKCRLLKPEQEYAKCRWGPKKPHICNHCVSLLFGSPESRKIQRDIWLKRKYKISSEEYETIFKSQNYVCKICGKPENTKRRFPVDHNHQTNKIRGILCWNCNTGLGKFKDNPELLLKAVDYLKTCN